MRILVLLALAATWCAAPAMAQTDFVDEDTPRPTDVAGQIKQDLQRLKQNFSSTNDSDILNAAVYEARPGFFGASEWMRGFVKLLNGNSVTHLTQLVVVAWLGVSTSVLEYVELA